MSGYFSLSQGSVFHIVNRSVTHTTFSLLQSIDGTKQQQATDNVKERHIPYPTLKEYVRCKEKQSKPGENYYN